jgi:hypothetical protein
MMATMMKTNDDALLFSMVLGWVSFWKFQSKSKNLLPVWVIWKLAVFFLILKYKTAKYMVEIQVKSTIHEMIDKINDANYLHDIYDSLTLFLNQKGDILDELSPLQQKRISESLAEVKNGNYTTNEQMKEEVRKWLTK